MKPFECELESEVLGAVLQDRWPARVDASLREHVAVCPVCSDVVAIAGAIDHDRDELRSQAVVPESGRVWWLAQTRARREAAQAAGRPITVAQVLAFACAMAVLGACFGATSAWFQAALRRTGSTLSSLKLTALLPIAQSFAADHAALLLAMASIVVVIPASIYFTLLRE